MSEIAERIAQLEPEWRKGARVLTDEIYEQIMAARERGVTWREVYAVLPPGMYCNVSSLQRAVTNERDRRAKVARHRAAVRPLRSA